MPLTASDHELRRTRLTATDVVVITGESPYASRGPHDVFMHKTDPDWKPTAETTEMKLGNLAEDIALGALAQERGMRLIKGHSVASRRYPWLAASPDAFVMEIGCEGVLLPRVSSDREEETVAAAMELAESKSVFNPQFIAHWHGGEKVPGYVTVQAQVQMTVCEKRRVHVPAILNGQEFLLEVEHDEGLESVLLEVTEKWWRDHVVARVPPPIDGSESSERLLRALYKRSTGVLVRASAEAETWARQWFAAREKKNQAEADEEMAKQQLCAIIGENAGLEGDGWRCTWVAPKSGAVSWKAIAETFKPSSALIAQHTGEPSRRFLPKATKG